MTKRALAQQLAVVAGFDDPRAEWEQYRTPPDVAAHLVHVADVNGDVDGHTVFDLGTGTGMLALGAALRGPRAVIGVDRDPDALGIARENQRRVGTRTEVSWLLADATRLPVCPADRDATVIMNPPFGAQAGSEHADRAFLAEAARVASVSYSIHNAGSREFVEAFADDHGGRVTHAYAVELDVDRQYEWHEHERSVVDAEAFRVEWAGGGNETGPPGH
jgi:putative methylase